MKYNVQNLAFLSAVISFASCQQHKQSTIDESGTEVVKVRQPTEDTLNNVEMQVDAPVEPVQKPTQPVEKPVKVEEIKKPTDVTGKKPAPSQTVKGVVKDINNGKDGYTAKLETPSGQIVAVTISRSNLTNPRQYRTVAVGDILKVTGESWKLDGVSQLTVREIH